MASFDGLNSTFRQRLEALISAAPGSVTLNSGHRTRAQQAALYAKNPRLAAPPGHSNHERGLAGDLGFANDSTKRWVHANAARFGLFFPMSHEPWHIEPIGARDDSGSHQEFDAQAYTDAPYEVEDPEGAEEDKVLRLFGIALGRNGAAPLPPNQQSRKRQSTTPGGATTYGGGNVSFGQAYQFAIKAGATPEEARLLAAIAMPESGLNPRAHNPNAGTGDNSYGLWQINMLGGMGPSRRQQFGIGSNEELFDPAVNARAAVAILRSQGPKAWSVYRKGLHNRYLAQVDSEVTSSRTVF